MNMLCYFKYGDNHSLVEDLLSARSSKCNNLKSSNKSSRTKVQLTDENKTLVINPDCFVQILIDFLAGEMCFDKTREFDICDSSGELLEIKKLEPWEACTKVLIPLHTYCVVLFERSDEGGVKSFEILLNNGSDLHVALSKKLKRFIFGVRSDRRLSSTSKSTPRMLNYDRSPRRRSIRSMSSRSSKSQTIL